MATMPKSRSPAVPSWRRQDCLDKALLVAAALLMYFLIGRGMYMNSNGCLRNAGFRIEAKQNMTTVLTRGPIENVTKEPLHGGLQFGNRSVLGDEDVNPYGADPWMAAADPECVFYGASDGLFVPSTPRPRYIVTGGAGFIGSHLVKRLAAQSGAGQVKVIDNFWRGQLSKLQHENGSWSIDPQRDVCALDLRNEQHTLKFLRGADYVYHLADIVAGVDYVFRHQLSVFHDNVLINTNTLKASKVNKIPNYIYVGTASSFPQHLQMRQGVHALHENETYPAGPESSYGWSKLMGEYEAELSKSATFRVGILRLHNVYGPGSDHSAATSQVVSSLLHKGIKYPKEPFMVWGSGGQYRDFVYVDDVVNALLLVKEKGMNQGVIQIGSGHATTIKQLATNVAEIVGNSTGSQIVIQYDVSMAEGYHGSIADLDRAQSVLGWQPHVQLQAGLLATYNWLVKRISKPTLLVVVNGQPRGGELAWKSLHKHVLKPYGAHLATYFTQAGPNGTLLERMAQYTWKLPEHEDWGVIIDKAAKQCHAEHSGGPDWQQLCGHENSIWAGGIAKCPKHKSKAGVLLAFRWLVSQKILSLHLQQQYDYIMYTRADYLYLCNHVPPESLDGSATWVPLGEEYGGLTDRHLVSTAPNLLRAINITQELVCSPDAYKSRITPIINNVESLQALVWRHTGVLAKQFHSTMFTVRAKGDPTSWSVGDAHAELEKYGLLVKYPKELDKALGSCNVNITEVLQSLSSYQVLAG